MPAEPTWDMSTSRVSANIENSQLFGRFSVLASAIDAELMAGTFYDANPTNHITRIVDPVTHQLTGIIVRPEHHRLGILGGGFAKTVAGVVVRSEGAFYQGKYFNIEDPTFADGTVEKNYVHYLLGFDYNIFGIDVSGQFIQEVILGYDNAIRNDQFSSTATFLARQNFLRETLSVDLFVYYGLNDGDTLIRPKLTYDLADGFEVLLGGNIFTGPADSPFGQFHENDMVYTKVKYSF